MLKAKKYFDVLLLLLLVFLMNKNGKVNCHFSSLYPPRPFTLSPLQEPENVGGIFPDNTFSGIGASGNGYITELITFSGYGSSGNYEYSGSFEYSGDYDYEISQGFPGKQYIKYIVYIKGIARGPQGTRTTQSNC